MTRRSAFVRTAVVLSVAGLALAACSSSSSGGGASTAASGGGGSTLKIGFMGDLTGPNKALGINIRNGEKLAIDQYNATNPKVKIQLLEFDSQGDPKQAAALAPKAIDDGIVGLVGPAFSGETANTGALWQAAGVPFISASATRVNLADNGWTTFHRVLADDGYQGPGVANVIAKSLKATKVAVIDDASDYGKGLADAVASALKTAGVAVPVDESVPATGTEVPDYSSTITKIKSAGVSVVFYGGYYAQSGPFAKQLKDGGVTATFISGDGSLDPAFVSGAGAAANGSILSCACALINSAATGSQKTFYDAYKAAFNVEPGTYSPEAYDAATVFINAIKAGNTDRKSIETYVNGVNFDGVSKHIQFESNGNIKGGTILIYQVQNGQIVGIGTSDNATPQS
ncbi:MAG TPA: branched-chain amino acid ABC transporter substrate-binding protein [Actinomycetes bacterium]|nr:branched-chain amino acid ABC transporter substrate-binding protein [Actinomycetes bacterium]